jgi:hypothetical protein
MGPSGEHDIDVEVRADRAVPPAATARAVELVRRLARGGRQTQYAAVTLDVDDQWRGRRSRQVEIVVDMVGIYVRGFAAGATFTRHCTNWIGSSNDGSAMPGIRCDRGPLGVPYRRCARSWSPHQCRR